MPPRPARLAALMATAALVATASPANGAATEERSFLVPNQNLAAKGLTQGLAGTDPVPAKQLHTQLRVDLREEMTAEPRRYRNLAAVGPLHGNSFTVRFGADRACVTVDPGKPAVVTPRPCRPGDVTAKAPLRNAALYTALFAQESSGGAYEISPHLSAKRLGRMASSAAPQGARVFGVTDRNGDRLDDDGRVGFADQAGNVVCLVVPFNQWDGVPKVRTGRCGDLVARDTTHLSAKAQLAKLKAETLRVAGLVQELSVNLDKPVNELTYSDLAAIDATVGKKYWLLWFPQQGSEPTSVRLEWQGFVGIAKFTSETVGAGFTYDLGQA